MFEWFGATGEEIMTQVFLNRESQRLEASILLLLKNKKMKVFFSFKSFQLIMFDKN